MRRTLEVAGLAFALMAGGCTDSGTRPPRPAAAGPDHDQRTVGLPAPEPAVPVEKGNFTLYVSNQSIERPTMPITVTVDGRQVVSSDFHVGNQHQFLRFTLDLASGRRRIEARAGDGTAVDATFTMPEGGERWGVLTFWAAAAYYAPHFRWHYLEEMPLFG